MPLTPADVHNVAFSKALIGKRGYNEDEVDAFLDLVEAELARLIEEVAELQAAAVARPASLFDLGRQMSPTTDWNGAYIPEQSSVSRPRDEAGSGIFISYRRGDERNFAGRLFERLSRHYDASQLFMDVDSIELGLDFRDVIDRWLSQCSVMLVVIGRNWLNAVDAAGRRRLDNPDDLVRLEVAAALSRRDVRVIPILVESASSPGAAELPGPLAPLARRHGLQMSHEGFGSDFDRLLRALEQTLVRSL